MDKKIIKIFIASSLDEFHDERNELAAFIYSIGGKLRERFLDSGIYFDIMPVRCEEVDPAYRKGRTQDEFNALLAECEMCVFLFFTKVGEYTIEEFDVARKAFEASDNGRPKIYTYFKQCDGADLEDSVTRFMETLDKTFQHFYNFFESIDTVKLRLIMELSILNEGFLALEMEDGKVYLGGQEAMKIDGATQFANNQVLNGLQKELKQVEEKYYPMKAGYPFDDDEKDREYRELASRRQFLTETIEELQKQIFNMTLSICRDDASGKEITARTREAYRLFEMGDLDGANLILDYQEIKSEYLRRKKMREDEQKKDDALYIRELKAKIRILMASVNYADRFAEIDEIYQEAVEVAKQHNVELDTIYDYASYLDDQGHSDKAYEVASLLEAIYESDSSVSTDAGKAALNNLLGIICGSFPSKAKECEHYYLKAIAIRETLAKENPERYNTSLASSYNNAGVFYTNQGQPEKAEDYYLKAIAIREKLARENPERYNADLASSYNNTGNFYINQGQPEKAEDYYLKAIAISEKLARENPERYNTSLAGSYNNAGLFYNDQGEPVKAEDYYLKAIAIYEMLAKVNPERYNTSLAGSYNNAGLFYNDQGEPVKAEDYYLKAIAIRETLAKDNPERNNANLASSYNNAGVFYKNQGQPEKAEDYYLKAIAIREKLVRENPERYNADLASSYNNAGIFYKNQGQPEKAEDYYLKAIAIIEKLARENPERYNADLASSYNNAGVFYKNQGQPEKAEDYYLKAIAIRETLAKDNPERYNANLASSYNNAGLFYNDQGEPVKAEDYYLKAIAIYEMLAKVNPERYNADLAVSYWNFGLLKKERKYFYIAYELAKKSRQSPTSRRIIEVFEKDD